MNPVRSTPNGLSNMNIDKIVTSKIWHRAVAVGAMYYF